MGSADLLMHPVRVRIVKKLIGNPSTPAELREQLGDVPPASLYRHIKALADGGVIVSVGERQARGAVEHTYALRPDAARIGADQARTMTTEDHCNVVTALIAGLLAEFDEYFDGPDPDPIRDGLAFQEAPLYLSPEEVQEMAQAMAVVLRPYLANGPAPGRRRLMFSTVVIPSPEPDHTDRPSTPPS
ncbi:helix-turn-helix domain-containing protein [Actinomadura harenae]|nr:helix-turn-helix domain-containing protein [Actinomadura harenae]